MVLPTHRCVLALSQLAEGINFSNLIAHVTGPFKTTFRELQNPPGHGPELLAAAERQKPRTT